MKSEVLIRHLKQFEDARAKILAKALEEDNLNEVEYIIKVLVSEKNFEKLRQYFDPLIEERAQTMYKLIEDLPQPIIQFILIRFLTKYLDDLSRVIPMSLIAYVFCNALAQEGKMYKSGPLGKICVSMIS